MDDSEYSKIDTVIEPFNLYLRDKDKENIKRNTEIYHCSVDFIDSNNNAYYKQFEFELNNKSRSSWNNKLWCKACNSVVDFSHVYTAIEIYDINILQDFFDLVRKYNGIITTLYYVTFDMIDYAIQSKAQVRFIEGMQEGRFNYCAEMLNIRDITFDINTIEKFITSNNVDLTHDLLYHSEISNYLNESTSDFIAIANAGESIFNFYFNNEKYKMMMKMLCPQVYFYDLKASKYNGPQVINPIII